MMMADDDKMRLHGFVPTDNGSWFLPGFNTVLVEGKYVPAHHEGLYRRIFESHGHLVCRPIFEGSERLLMNIVYSVMDNIAEIESVRATELSRERLDNWFDMLRYLKDTGFSLRWLGWLRPKVEELDRVFRRLELVEEFRRADPELADRMEVLMAGFEKARDEEKEIQTAMAANTLVLDKEEKGIL